MRTLTLWTLCFGLALVAAVAQTRRPVNSSFPEQLSPDVILTISVNQTAGATTNASCVAQVVIAGVTNGPSITILWSQASGPGLLTFTDASAFSTEASASTSGTYTIACLATWKTKTSSATFTFFSVDNTITAVPVLPGPVQPASFYRGINMNGDSIMIGSNLWESSTAATVSGTAIADQTVTLTPAAEANTATMIKSSLTGAPTCTLESVPSGAYLLRVYTWGWSNTNAFDLTINGSVHGTQFFATTNQWAALGFSSPIYVTAGTINVSLNQGNLSGVEVWRLAENSIPDIALTSPTNGASFITPVTIPLAATASDRDGSITNVAFYSSTGAQESILLGSVTSPPYAFSVTNIPAGNYTFLAVATDNQGATNSSDATSINVTTPIPNIAPSISITAPADATVYIAPADITITASASDPDGTITSVSFFTGSTLLSTDTTPPYTALATAVPAGTFSIRAEAIDDDGAITSSSTIHAIVNNNVVPSVTLTSPTNGAGFIVPVTIPLAATASDSDGSVVSVSFYSGSTLLGTDTSAPYTYSYVTPPAGNYSFTAVATDDLGATNTSGAASINISPANVPPVVSITVPTNGQVYIAPATIAITAAASDSDGTIATVNFFTGTTTLLGVEHIPPYNAFAFGVAAGTFPIHAEAIDDDGAVTASATINVIVVPNAAPSVAMTAPTNGASFLTPVTIPLAATAADSDGTIVSVKFYSGGTLLSTDTSAPYTYSYVTPPAGNYSFTAVATDNLGATNQSAAVSINISDPAANIPPIVAVTSPTNTQAFIEPASFTITATASDSDGSVVSVSFYNGSTLLGTDTSSPYTATVSAAPAGAFPIRAEATDDDGAITSSATVNVVINANAVPLVSLTSPTNGAGFIQPVTIPLAATASDSDGSVVSVKFYSGATLLGTDTSSPYTFSVPSAAVGPYSFRAVATDNLGATNISGAVTVNVSAANVPPIVSISSPTNGQTYIAPAAFTIAASASDPDGTVSSVSFYSGATFFGTDLTSPYTDNVSNAPVGNYALRAEATDNNSAVTASATVNVIVVANAIPTVAMTSPANGASFLTPVTISLAATAADSDGSVASVKFYNGATLLGTDTTAPYTFSIPNAGVGAYSFTAVATDDRGATNISGACSINISAPIANIPPSVSITSPTNGQAFTAPASFTVTATAADTDGTVTSVTFFQGSTPLGTDTTSPYTVGVGGVPAGTLAVRADATDDDGAVTSSATINLIINPVVIPLSAFAGQDQVLTLPAIATLAGSVAGSGITSTNWSKLSGPGTVTFGNANAVATTATFSASGTYSLQLACFSATSSAADSATFTVLPAVQPTAVTNSLPLEVAGENGFSKVVQFVMPTVTAGATYDLYLRVHNLGDTNKAQVRINNGAFISLNNTATLLGNARAYGGIGGAFHTIKMTVPIPPGTLVTGLNTLEAKILYSSSGGVNPIRPSGYRIIDWNVRLAGVDKIPATSFVQENPNSWQPPHNTAAEIAQGQVLWSRRNSLVDNGVARIAACSDCHAVDGRDLKYYNFSNLTIIERSKFHGLSQLDGELIASYIRSVDTPNPGRPWNPPYQPGPGLDSLPVSSWAAGAGIDAVVDNDQTTIADIFGVPPGTNPTFTNYQAISRTNNTNAREVRVALQFPDWNHWLPTIHPFDAYGIAAFVNSGSKLFTSYEGGTNGASVGTQFLKNTLSVGSAASLANSKFILAAWILEQSSETSPFQVSISPKTSRSTMAAAQKAYATACWQIVKMWELHQKYKLEDLAGANVTRPNYVALYDAEYTASQSSYDSLASSSSGQSLYSTIHQMQATLSMWEATSNVVYLTRSLAWAETIMSRQTIIDSDGKKNYPGTWASPYSATPIAFEVEEYQGTAELTRLCRIILTTPVLSAYVARATLIYNQIRDHTVNKILITRGGQSAFVTFLSRTTGGMNDKPSLMLRNMLNLSLCSTALGNADNTIYGWPATIASWASGMKDHFGGVNRWIPYAGGLDWDYGFGLESPYTSMDTDHANRIPPIIIELIRSGNTSFDRSYLKGMATLFTEKMWNQSLTAPAWVNFTDGSNGDFRTYGPYLNGAVSYGWNWLAEYDATTFAACSALLTYLGTGVTGNRNDNQFYRIGLQAELARCAARVPNGSGVFQLGAEPRTQYSKRVYFDVSPNILGLQPNNHGVNDSTDPILFNYFSVAWYNVQLCIDGGNHSPDIFYQTSQTPVDWPYVVNKIKDLQVLTPTAPLAGEFLLFKIKSLQASSKLYGPKRWNSGGYNPYLTTNPDDFVFRDFNGFWGGTTAAARKAITVSYLRNWIYENKKYPVNDYYTATDLPVLTTATYVPVAQRTAEHFGDFVAASFIPETGGGYYWKNLGTSGLAIDTDLQDEILDWAATVWPLGWRRTVGGAINTWASLKP